MGITHLELSVVCVGDGHYWISFQRQLPGETQQRRLSGKCSPHSTGASECGGSGGGA